MTHLEAIIAIANNEELIEKRKKVLRKQKEELLEKDEKERHWISKQPNLSISGFFLVIFIGNKDFTFIC